MAVTTRRCFILFDDHIDWVSYPGMTQGSNLEHQIQKLIFSILFGLFPCSLIVMYFILPETEQRSLEDIELHFIDNTKNITDVHIPMNGKHRAKTIQ